MPNDSFERPTRNTPDEASIRHRGPIEWGGLRPVPGVVFDDESGADARGGQAGDGDGAEPPAPGEESQDGLPGCLSLLPAPLANLFRDTLLSTVMNPDGPAGGLENAAALMLDPCARAAEPVSPEVCPPLYRVQRVGRNLREPNRRKTMRANRDAELEDVNRRIAELERELRDMRAAGAVADDGGAGARKIAAKRTELEALRTRKTELEAARDDAPEAPPAGSPAGSGEIRQAGRTQFAYDICYYWKDSTVAGPGGQELRCCTLAFIRVVVIGLIVVSTTKKLYLHVTDGVDRLNQDEYDDLDPAARGEWVEAVPFSIEAHERAHVRDLKDKLAARLAAVSYVGFASHRQQLVAQQASIDRGLRRTIDGFIKSYTAADMKAYPHGESETAAVEAQRRILTSDTPELDFERQKEREKEAWEGAIAAKKAAEAALAPCPFAPPPEAGAPHCLDRHGWE